MPSPPRSACSLSSFSTSLYCESSFLTKFRRIPSPLPWIILSTGRSEEHTSELQSRENRECRLLLEKKNKHTNGCPRRTGSKLEPRDDTETPKRDGRRPFD